MDKASWFGVEIAINQKVGPVDFQYISPHRQNGTTALRYVAPYFNIHKHNMFQHDNVRAYTSEP